MNSLLHISVKENLIELVCYLLLKQVSINAQNKDGDTPLHLAIRDSNGEMISLLMECHAKLDIQNHKGIAPIDEASVSKAITF